MGGIAYLHSAYLFPSDNDLLQIGSNSNSRNNKKNQYLTLGHIREPPSFGSAPVNGVDEEGFEIIEEPFADMGDMGQLQRQRDGDVSSSPPNEEDRQEQKRLHPRIQFSFEESSVYTGDVRVDRLATVKDMIRHAWLGFVPRMQEYNNVRLQDIKSKAQRTQIRGEWIDVMDTLLLASMTNEYKFAKDKVMELTGNHHLWREQGAADAKEQVKEEEKQTQTQYDLEDDASNEADTHGIGFFETVVQQLGGLLSIYELERAQSNETPEILEVAVELGDQLTVAFQGSNSALPASTIFSGGRVGFNKVLAGKVSLAEVSTFQLEFRQLSHLSSNAKYKDMAERNIEYLASLDPGVPGLYPAYFDPKDGVASEYVASFGSLSDGFYEYLLKTYLLTGDAKFKDLYISSVEAMHKHLISRSQKSTELRLILGVYDTATDTLVPKMDHLSCFAPGLLALGSKLLDRPKDLSVARGLMETCFMSYQNSATGLGADEIAFLRPEFSKGKEFEMLQRGPGFYVIDSEYALRPGDSRYQEYAWEIAQAIEKHCRTKHGYSGLVNVMDASAGMTNTMPSYFMSQTLKYLYLIFDDPKAISLDDYVFNTGGHLLKYPIP
ncbi:hypothetical protein EC991_000631 [Linnemannia zychae]|nr:hypothetical protein EC991_000631 [Linnemannia zychae]